MIKFNFNANVNIKNNGSKLDKKGLKTILIVFTVFILVFIISAISMTSFAFNSINSLEQRIDDYNKQAEAIPKLPVLKCKIYTDNTVTAPLSGQQSSLYLLRVGTVKYSKRLRKTDESFDYSMVIGYPKGTQVSVNGQLYPIDFKLCIVDNPDTRNMPYLYETFATSHNTPAFLINYKRNNNQKIPALKNTHPWIEFFIEHSSPNNLILNEYIFKNGDSLYIKGKIENNKIVPFVEHMVQ